MKKLTTKERRQPKTLTMDSPSLPRRIRTCATGFTPGPSYASGFAFTRELNDPCFLEHFRVNFRCDLITELTRCPFSQRP
jgi:hypothetical protein